ncbi:MAG: PilZ domain-containing protein [Treponema sp.]|nr:PilZ domain-containing protein [Treponema sp.]
MSNAGIASDILGKKIFFLYPTAVVQNRVVSELTQQEFEVYIAKDKDTLRRVLRKYPDSVVFVDINEHMTEKEWDSWITEIMNAQETKGVSLGIVTANDDELVKRKYLMANKIPCGYTVLKSDLDKAVTHIMEVLKTVDAKGRRKYIRATTEHETNATVNLPLNGMFVNGQIKDISVVGVSCTLSGNPDIERNSLFKDIQVKLQSNLLKVEGIVIGSRMDGKEKIYVVLFTQRIDPDVRTRIRKYIQQNLQGKMDSELR